MSDHITITGRSGDNANLPAVLRGYVERFELTSPMVKQMMLDAADEIERLKDVVREAARRLIANGDGYGAHEAIAALEPRP